MYPIGYNLSMATRTANRHHTPAEQLDMFAEAALDERENAERTTGVPSLYAMRCNTIDEYEQAMGQWQEDWGTFGSILTSHGWHVSVGEIGWSKSSMADTCIPITLSAYLGCDHRSRPKQCFCVGRGVYRSFCRGCGWHSEVADDENDAVLLGLDHCFPGWREDPIVPSAPYEAGPKRRTRLTWEAKVAELHGTERPDGYPMITQRGPRGGWRAVPGRSLWGGYDVAAETIDH